MLIRNQGSTSGNEQLDCDWFDGMKNNLFLFGISPIRRMELYMGFHLERERFTL